VKRCGGMEKESGLLRGDHNHMGVKERKGLGWCPLERDRRAAVRQLALDGRKNNALENLGVHAHIRWLANTGSSCKKNKQYHRIPTFMTPNFFRILFSHTTLSN
jgi:hypothetical protein